MAPSQAHSQTPNAMPDKFSYDAVVVGSGPNGLAAAIRLAQEHLTVLVLEAKDSIGGGTRSAEITLPGFLHDLCSAIHPLGIGSPFLRQLPLEKYGLSWIQPEFPLAHPFDDGTAAVLKCSIAATGEGLGLDKSGYEKLMAPLLGKFGSRIPATAAPFSPTSVAARRLWPARFPFSHGLGHELVFCRACPGAVCWPGRAFFPAARASSKCSLWPCARFDGPRGRLAITTRRFTANRQCAGCASTRAGRRNPDQPPG